MNTEKKTQALTEETATKTIETNEVKVTPIIFNGTAKEYFGIWIVNTLYTVLTLGIYSAWAKVRTKRYFYGNTLLDGHPFDFTGQGGQIFKGLLIAGLVYGGYSAVASYNPLWGLFYFLFIAACMPWVIIQSLSFRFRNTTYRGLRFNFQPNYRSATFTFLVLPTLLLFTLGLILPYYSFKQRTFVAHNVGYGTSRFKFDAGFWGYYKIYLMSSLLLLLLVATPVGLMVWQITSALAGSQTGGIPSSATGGVLIVLQILTGVGLCFVIGYGTAKTNNYIWNNITLDGHQFQSQLKPIELSLLYLTNIIAISLSFGLLIPWAKIRMARYRIENIRLISHEPLSQFIGRAQDEVSAAGEEIGEAFDVDIGL